MAKNSKTQTSTFGTLRDSIAAAHRIHPMEATDEVCEAWEICYGGETPETFEAFQVEALTEYIAEQYATNRTRLAGK